jgi:phage terminase large subunit
VKYTGIDFKDPDQTIRIAFLERTEVIFRIRKDPAKHVPLLKAYYKDHIADFINDWGCTFDPKHVELGLPALVPFVLFPKQREWVDWVIAHWKAQKPGLTEKTRQMGMSWLTVAVSCAICLFHPGAVIGFGSRKQEYIDEAAFLERPQMVEASLSQTTNCRMDVSTPNGMGNAFAMKRFEGKVDVFTMHWRDDPRKDDVWYQKQVAELDPVTVAAELDINYSASVEGVLIPSAWVQAALDAHRVLGVAPTGARRAALDVADEGKDLNAFAGVRGCVLEVLEEWTGVGDDIFGTVRRAFDLCDLHSLDGFRYDADGLGAGVRGDARILNQGRRKPVHVEAFRGSGAVHDPEGEDAPGRKNQDYFANAKAQAWWALRTRFQKTYRWVRNGEVCPFDDIISLPRDVPNVMRLVSELSQPVYHVSPVGKVVVDKAPDGVRSPNLADALMIRFAPGTQRLKVNPVALQRSREFAYHRLMA